MIVFRGRDRAAPMPFGPYLAAAGWLAMLYGQEIDRRLLAPLGLSPLSMSQRLRIGLTGGIASGKSTVEQRFTELGIPVINADDSSRAVVARDQPGLAAVVARFGPGMLTREGELDRRVCVRSIFSRSAITPQRTRSHLASADSCRHGATRSVRPPDPMSSCQYPCSWSRGTRGRVDGGRILVVDTDEALQLERLMSRDTVSAEEARATLAAQASRAARLQAADDVLVNSRDRQRIATGGRSAPSALSRARRRPPLNSRFTMALLLDQNRTMNSYPEPHPDAEPQLAPVVYEQPLNERMRTFLRLEFLYTQASYHGELENPWSSRAAVSSLLEILAITARGDSRSDVLKELERHVNVLKEYQTKTGSIRAASNRWYRTFSSCARILATAGANFMGAAARLGVLERHQAPQRHPGRDLRLRSSRLFLSGSTARRPRARRSSAPGLRLIRPLCDSIAELLWLTRQNAKRKSETAPGGIFQLQFDRENPCQLVRVTLPPESRPVSRNQR